MKKRPAIVALLVAACVAGACASNSNYGHVGRPPPTAVFDCNSAHRLYTAYLANMVVSEPSGDEIQDANAAASYLAAWCGWRPPAGLEGAALTDVNEVPVLLPPEFAPAQ